ncbi:2-hydroxychromene-2-carboxylate isomerase [Roseateles paludis]|jgi:2-hydroxychromene-2-carboxylate isomerase|uniref:2-hydroxychromene-2-carboxylate isomerase n=1 Tax=Roseateles paludis TaxID=3145238 RepID=A0ABV0G7M7_9BURK
MHWRSPSGRAIIQPMNAPLHFYFDFSSPYSYLATAWVDEVAARHGRQVQWHAILLGAIFQTIGSRPLVDQPGKGDYSRRDFARSAAMAGLPFAEPAHFPISTHLAARVFWWLHGQDPARAKAWARAAYAAYFAHGLDLSDPDALRQVCTQAGLDATAAEVAWGDPLLKAQLKAENDAALAAGVFGAPYLVIDGEPFWGNDRRDQVEWWLGGAGPQSMASR